MTSLYNIAEEYRQAVSVLADLDIDEQTVHDTLEGLAGALEVKATNVAMFVRELEVTADAIKEAEQNMAARRKALEARAERVASYLKNALEVTGIQKIECPYFKIALKNNPPSVMISDESAIPAKYMRTPPPPKPTPDKKAIAVAIKEGADIPGAHLVQSTRLEIK